ncbi:hypothetical protein ZHAS_00021738 [Anopheles sinensis]|uniref:Uncharacterized protein n=1 Tax=Anopheles sinensis TaxID=74873 RepID=A0A084WTG7_ANOSI|nr:hypothetical protein ZHAS_00021738 [Anopheles sinensis]
MTVDEAMRQTFRPNTNHLPKPSTSARSQLRADRFSVDDRVTQHDPGASSYFPRSEEGRARPSSAATLATLTFPRHSAPNMTKKSA